MGRIQTSRLGAALPVLAAAGVVVVASADPGFLAVASPLLLALIPLVAGLFPGERAIERATLWLDGFRVQASRSGGSSRLPVALLGPVGRVAGGPVGASGCWSPR